MSKGEPPGSPFRFTIEIQKENSDRNQVYKNLD